VEKILPLTIEPQPAIIHRVFVGRMELLTPATQNAIETAIVTHDKATLAKYGRFVAPMIESILHQDPNSAHAIVLGRELNDIYVSYLAQNAAR
jgi:hypothetical protein